MRKIIRYFDKFGLLATLEDDGGDSAFFTGHYYLNAYSKLHPIRRQVARELDSKLSLLEVSHSKGNYIRHPDPSMWYSDADRMSRDQMTSIIICMVLYELDDRAQDFFYRWFCRWMFMTNTRRNGTTRYNDGKEYKPGFRRNYNWKLPDFAPQFLGIFLRYRGWTKLLPICDLELLYSSIKEWAWPKENGDILNLIAKVYFANQKHSSFVSRAARRVLKRCDLQGQVEKYCLRASAKYPPLDIEMKGFIRDL